MASSLRESILSRRDAAGRRTETVTGDGRRGSMGAGRFGGGWVASAPQGTKRAIQGGMAMNNVSGESIRIRLTDEMKQWLFQYSELSGKTVSQVIREAISEYIEKNK